MVRVSLVKWYVPLYDQHGAIKVVGGVTPGKGGQTHLGLPVFKHDGEFHLLTLLLSMPAPFVLDSIVEAVDAGVKLIIVITEGVPTLDMLKAKRYIEEAGLCMHGYPNWPRC